MRRSWIWWATGGVGAVSLVVGGVAIWRHSTASAPARASVGQYASVVAEHEVVLRTGIDETHCIDAPDMFRCVDRLHDTLNSLQLESRSFAVDLAGLDDPPDEIADLVHRTRNDASEVEAKLQADLDCGVPDVADRCGSEHIQALLSVSELGKALDAWRPYL
jgi:hypothetical protein